LVQQEEGVSETEQEAFRALYNVASGFRAGEADRQPEEFRQLVLRALAKAGPVMDGAFQRFMARVVE
jgi:hypothetical protein